MTMTNDTIATADRLTKQMRALEDKARRKPLEGTEEREFERLAAERWAILTQEAAAAIIVRDTNPGPDALVRAIGVAAVAGTMQAETDRNPAFTHKLNQLRKANQPDMWLHDLITDTIVEQTLKGL